MPASRSSIAPNTLGESTRGRHIHSTAPEGATSATVSQSDRKAYSAIGGNELVPSRGSSSRSRVGSAGAGAGERRPLLSRVSVSSRKRGSIVSGDGGKQTSGGGFQPPVQGLSAADAAEHGERTVQQGVVDGAAVALDGHRAAGRRLAAHPLGERLRAVLVGGADQEVAEAVQVGNALL